MNVTDTFINITSEDAERLVAFYHGTVGLPMRPEMGDHSVQVGGTTLSFDTHSETRGATKEPSRVIVSMLVDDLAAEQSRLEALGVKFSRTAGKEFWGGLISTFNDPDGNILQLVQFTPE